MALTPDEWLYRLAVQMDARRSRIDLLRSYMDGNAPLPEGADNCREAYQKFQRKARTNFGELVVDAVAERLCVTGFQVGNRKNVDAWRIWKRNRMQVKSFDLFRDMLGLSAGYLMLSPSPNGTLITQERPEQAITESDPTMPELVRAGMKIYRDGPMERDVAFLHLPGAVFLYHRAATDSNGMVKTLPYASSGWKLVDQSATGLSFVPMYPFENRERRGEFETHLDLLDRINWGILQRLVITAMQAYRQRGIKGDLPAEDEDGNEIDYREMFRPGPGELWQLPEGADIWESKPADLNQILFGVKDDVRDLAAVTRTPLSAFVPDGANQTAEGAAFAREGLVFKTGDRAARADSSLAAAMGGALAMDAGESVPVPDVETLWAPFEMRSLAERADASTKAQDLPWRTRMQEVWGFSEERIDEMEPQRAADALIQSFAPTPNQRPAQASGDADAG
ncbi:phage portal protein [Mycobacterium sp. CnD-18-1]|uniref:phage portal protein n=1 Tax=Mycobacterium sp. CnD-18-1 TaxID=2917744 RepID=UPI001EF31806|nr:phage portal protein [Mycobacterium sp. CnD-18-1]MCG7610352.1 phage portal protein [Mycobacterium sp. CnD-18-1]